MNLAYEASGLAQGAYSYINAHIDALDDLPPPGVEWDRYDIDDTARPHLQKLVSDGAVKVVGEDGGYNQYLTTENAYEIVQECDDGRSRLLCGHSGIRNIGDGLYTCGLEQCNHRYTRDTMELLLD